MSSYLDNAGVTRLATDLKAKLALKDHEHAAADVTSGTLPVERGGTGKATHTANAVLTGNGTGAVGNLATASGALFATAANGAAQFGTLPVAQGGTGATTAANARTNLDAAQSNGAAGTLKAAEDAIDDLTESIAPVESTTATSNHAIGDYFMLGNVLMKATAAIATGEQITTSNATPATVQSQIDALRDSVSVETGTVTLDTTKISSGTASVIRFGRLIVLRMDVWTAVEILRWDRIATVQEGFRPISSTRMLVAYGESGTRVGAVENTGGVLIAGGTVPAGIYLAISAVYFSS